MRRVLVLLKYVPAALCGLLVVAWVVSISSYIACHVPFADSYLQISCKRGSMTLMYWCGRKKAGVECNHLGAEGISADNGLGYFAQVTYNDEDNGFSLTGIDVPIPFVLTILGPFSLAPLTHFRFPLWSYFAWTALVAAELAYYLG